MNWASLKISLSFSSTKAKILSNYFALSASRCYSSSYFFSSSYYYFDFFYSNCIIYFIYLPIFSSSFDSYSICTSPFVIMFSEISTPWKSFFSNGLSGSILVPVSCSRSFSSNKRTASSLVNLVSRYCYRSKRS